MLLPLRTDAAQTSMSQQENVKAALLIEVQTGKRLWELNADKAFPVAGLSKLPSLLTLTQTVDEGSLAPDAAIRVSERAAAVTGPTAFLENAEEISASELLKAAVMISAGDAITALGEAAYGSESVFCGNVNITLEQMGIQKEVADSLGSLAEFSASDMAMLGSAACASVSFSKYCLLYFDSITHADGRMTELVNANRLLNNYAGCTGLLTGSSQTDGYCGVFSASRGGTALIAVVIGAESAAVRAAAAVEMLDFGFANFRLVTLAQQDEAFVTELPVRNGNIKKVNLIARERIDEVVDAQAGALTEQVNAPEYLEAPFDATTVLGSVDFLDGSGEAIASLPLYASEPAAAYGVKDLLKRIMLAYIGYLS